MWSTADTTRALVKARNDSVPLSAAKTDDSAPTAAGTVTGSESVAAVLEAIGAVVPTGIIAIYGGAAVGLRQVAISAGASSRAKYEAKLKVEGKTVEQIAEIIEKLPQEPSNFVEGRILLLVFAGVVALIMSVTAAKAGNSAAVKQRKLPFAEPFVAVVAFVGFALASPGTPLAAYHSSSTMLAITIMISAIAGLTLTATGSVSLVKPAKRAD